MKVIEENKVLSTVISKKLAELSALSEEVRLKKEELEQKKAHVEALKKKAKETPRNIVVSEHAMLRYFERVKGFDLKQIKQEILSQEVRDWVEKMGPNGEYPNGDFSVVLKNNVIVTVKN